MNYGVIPMHTHTTIVAVKKAISITHSEFVSVALVIQHAQRMRRIILLSVACVVKVTVKCTLAEALRLCTGRTVHRGSRGIALPFHDHGTIWG